jgi:hypothetical protein
MWGKNAADAAAVVSEQVAAGGAAGVLAGSNVDGSADVDGRDEMERLFPPDFLCGPVEELLVVVDAATPFFTPDQLLCVTCGCHAEDHFRHICVGKWE